MRIEPLLPDASPIAHARIAPAAGAFARVLDGLGTLLAGANNAENAFAAGTGDLQSAVYQRARADVAISVATAAAQRAAQALQTLLNMQV